MTIEKCAFRTLQTLFVLVVALVIALHHYRIERCENHIEDLQKIIYLDWKIELYEDFKVPPLPVPKLDQEDDLKWKLDEPSVPVMNIKDTYTQQQSEGSIDG
tara:strand:- start:36 stop:341 length:306 start_codon:yes stop_codon:yes gene_type:complete